MSQDSAYWRRCERTKDRTPFDLRVDRRLMAECERRLGPGWRVRHCDADVMETFLHLSRASGPAVDMGGTAWLMERLLRSLPDADDLARLNPTADSVFHRVCYDLAARGGRCAANVGTVRRGRRLMFFSRDIPYHMRRQNIE